MKQTDLYRLRECGRVSDFAVLTAHVMGLHVVEQENEWEDEYFIQYGEDDRFADRHLTVEQLNDRLEEYGEKLLNKLQNFVEVA